MTNEVLSQLLLLVLQLVDSDMSLLRASEADAAISSVLMCLLPPPALVPSDGSEDLPCILDIDMFHLLVGVHGLLGILFMGLQALAWTC